VVLVWTNTANAQNAVLVDADEDARNLNQEQRFEREKQQMKRLSKEFAKLIVDGIDAP